MRAVQLQYIEASLMGAPRRPAPGLHQFLHLAALQRPWHRPLFTVGKRARRHRRPLVPVIDLGRTLQRPVPFPWAPGARLATGMTELNACKRVLLLDDLDEALQRLDKDVIPDAEVAQGATAAPLDLGRLDNHQSGAA